VRHGTSWVGEIEDVGSQKLMLTLHFFLTAVSNKDVDPEEFHVVAPRVEN